MDIEQIKKKIGVSTQAVTEAMGMIESSLEFESLVRLMRKAQMDRDMCVTEFAKQKHSKEALALEIKVDEKLFSC